MKLEPVGGKSRLSRVSYGLILLTLGVTILVGIYLALTGIDPHIWHI